MAALDRFTVLSFDGSSMHKHTLHASILTTKRDIMFSHNRHLHRQK